MRPLTVTKTPKQAVALARFFDFEWTGLVRTACQVCVAEASKAAYQDALLVR